jgi:hypothetical protein
MILDSETDLSFDEGVVLSKTIGPDSLAARFAFINRGAFNREYNESIRIDGLNLRCNGLDSRSGQGLDMPGIVSLSCQAAFFYVKNLEAVLHGGANLGAYEELLRVKKDSYLEPFAGATLRVHLGNFLWAPYDTYIGARYIYNFADPSKSGVEAVFSLDL